MGKKTIDSFFKKRGSQNVEDCANSEPSSHIGGTSTIEPEHRPLKSPRVEVQEFDKSTLVRDPGLREPILNLPTSLLDEATIDSVKYLTLHNCALRGRDERSTSSNRGNCIDLIEFLGFYNPDVHEVVLHNAPQNASYHSELAEKLAIDNDDDNGEEEEEEKEEVVTSKGKNQIRNLKRAGDTRWGSHLGSISSLMDLFSATCLVLKDIINDPDTTDLDLHRYDDLDDPPATTTHLLDDPPAIANQQRLFPPPPPSLTTTCCHR
ncbi:hypothetical protein Vadar_015586 [Vaccinium darrowii]|uniref:Uncharacterized protein n=1 Tax=Vaccinium darrowii TaxID=229202 RepID=A0ACB7ZJ89_9ERIC|nr:hypothetical protein Vadar_015586 [Vaccinium darrowii]